MKILLLSPLYHLLQLISARDWCATVARASRDRLNNPRHTRCMFRQYLQLRALVARRERSYQAACYNHASRITHHA